MARALLALAKGDIKAYASHNIMALPVGLTFLGELFCQFFGKYKTLLHFCCGIILVINFIYYVSRIALCFSLK